MLNIGIQGRGRIKQVHALSIRQLNDVRVAAVAGTFTENAQSLVDRAGAQVTIIHLAVFLQSGSRSRVATSRIRSASVVSIPD